MIILEVLAGAATKMADSLVEELSRNNSVVSNIANEDYISRMYDALAKKEHQGFIDRDDYSPWIRTNVRGSGSSAFGPVQLTGGKGSMMHNVGTGYTDIGATKEELDWINNVFLSQGENFLKWGGSDMPESGVDEYGNPVSQYDYGQSGDFTDKDRRMYEGVSKKLIGHELDRLDWDEEKFINQWRGKEDPDYLEGVRSYLY